MTDPAAAPRPSILSSPLPVEPSPKAVLALERLNASRLQLRQALIPAAARNYDEPEGDRESGAALPRRMRVFVRSLRQRIRRSPVATTLLASVQTWWWQHPWREPIHATTAELRRNVGPVVKRHPVAAVLLAGAAGAALVAWRPWRWPVVARQISPMPRQMARWVMAQLTQPAIQTILGGLMMSFLKRADNEAEASSVSSDPAASADEAPSVAEAAQAASPAQAADPAPSSPTSPATSAAPVASAAPTASVAAIKDPAPEAHPA